MRKIIILMATHNGAEYINGQIDSILEQSYKNWKLYIHDDGSMDGTIEILKKYAQNNLNIVFLNDDIKCGGAKENFSYLIDDLIDNLDDEFDYVMFSDQDDVWKQNKIEDTLNKMIETEKTFPDLPILVHTDLIVVDETLNIVSKSMRISQRLDISKQNNIMQMCSDNLISGCTIMINKSLFALSKNIPNVAIMHDTWIPLMALKYGGMIVYLDKGTLYYRQHGSNTTGSKEISLGFYFKRLFKIGKVVSEYKAMYIQCRTVDINISWSVFIFNRIVAVCKKMFGKNTLSER